MSEKKCAVTFCCLKSCFVSVCSGLSIVPGAKCTERQVLVNALISRRTRTNFLVVFTLKFLLHGKKINNKQLKKKRKEM